MQPNNPHPWPLPQPTPSQTRSRSESRHPNAPQSLLNTPTHRGSVRREVPAGPPAARPSQVPRHMNMTAVSDLPAVPMSPPIHLPTSIPQSAEASNTFMQEDTTSQAIVPVPSNFALAQTHANTSAMGASERNSMQAQIDALRN